MPALNRWIVIFVLLAASAAPSQAAPLAPDAGTTERVSLASDGTQGNDHSQFPSISADGRYVAFESQASNLVPVDTNGWVDIFVYDRLDRITEPVSVSTAEVQGNNLSYSPTISADGRFVAFESDATNLASGDTNATTDIFVRDRLFGRTRRMSLADDESQANGDSHEPSISADGRFVAYISLASNLVPGDTNGGRDVFVRDRISGSTERVSLNPAEEQGDGESFTPSISADGRYVAFSSEATNMVPGDTNGGNDVFVRDRNSGGTERVSVADNESQANDASYTPSISADGRFVAFSSDADNLAPGDTNGERDIFVRDRLNGTTKIVSLASDGSQANNYSYSPSISADGRFVAFRSYATNLVPGDTNLVWDIFVRDRLNGTTERVSIAGDESQGSSREDDRPSISADGRFVAFTSHASNLVPGDTNGDIDVFVRDRQRNGFSLYLPLALR